MKINLIDLITIKCALENYAYTTTDAERLAKEFSDFISKVGRGWDFEIVEAPSED